MRRGVRSRKHLYDNKYVAPPPLVPRYLRLPVRERVDVRGRGPDAARRGAGARGDRAARGARASRRSRSASCTPTPSPPTSAARRSSSRSSRPSSSSPVSSEILPQVRLNDRVGHDGDERVRRAGARALPRAADRGARRRRRFGGALLVMQSNGGVATPELVARNPAIDRPLRPGRRARSPRSPSPAARGSEDCIVVDMGGTSFDAVAREGRRGAGDPPGRDQPHAIALPMIDVHTIGAGGGSIGWLDDGGLLRMGPRSAGASPGPAATAAAATSRPAPTPTSCSATSTRTTSSAAGCRSRSSGRARRSSAASPGRSGSTRSTAAAAMAEVIDLNDGGRARRTSRSQRGYDPRELPLVVAGGAGPVHAGAIADELEISTIVVPRLSSVLCALGMLLADLRHDLTRSYSRHWERRRPRRGARRRRRAGAPGARGAGGGGRARRAAQRRRVAPTSATPASTTRCRSAFPPDDLDRPRADRGRRSTAGTRSSTASPRPGSRWRSINLHATVLGRRTAASSLEPPGGGGGEAPPPRRGGAIYLRSTGSLEEVEVLDGDRMSAGQTARRPGRGRHPDDDHRRAGERSTSPSTRSGSFVLHAREERHERRPDPHLVIANRLKAIGERMGLVVERSARSPLLVEGRDFSLGIYDADGVLLEQTEYIPVLGYATAPGMRAIAQAFAGQRPGGRRRPPQRPVHGRQPALGLEGREARVPRGRALRLGRDRGPPGRRRRRRRRARTTRTRPTSGRRACGSRR